VREKAFWQRNERQGNGEKILHFFIPLPLIPLPIIAFPSFCLNSLFWLRLAALGSLWLFQLPFLGIAQKCRTGLHFLPDRVSPS
jgi:hypothetical protein